MTRSGRLYRKSGKMASEELASFLYNLFCRFLVYYIIFEFSYLSGVSCVHFIPSKSVEIKVGECSPLRSVTFGGSHGIPVDSLATIRSGRSYRKSGEMASEELASFLYNLVCRYLVYYIIFECLYLSGLSCVHFIPSKSVELKVWECSPLRFVTFGGSRGIQLDSLAVRPYCYSWQQDLEDRVRNQERWHRRNLNDFCTILFADIWCITSFLSVCI